VRHVTETELAGVRLPLLDGFEDVCRQSNVPAAGLSGSIGYHQLRGRPIRLDAGRWERSPASRAAHGTATIGFTAMGSGAD